MRTEQTKAAQFLAKKILKHEGIKITEKQISLCIKKHLNSLQLLKNRIDNLNK